jgi:UDPglucose 6-dehydrogenase
MKLGVVGLGIVGNAFYEGMKDHFEIVRYDKFNKERSDVPDIPCLCSEVDGPIFVCVPTPMNADGTCNVDIVDSVLEEIFKSDFERASTLCCGYAPRIVVIKSTIPPGTTRQFGFSSKYSLKLVFNPEFLTEANPVADFKNQDRIILGGDPDATSIVEDVYDVAYPSVMKVRCNPTAAEMVKYVANCFLAMKVSFANEIYQICSALGIDYNTVINTATLDKRLGSSHWKVPGPDGHYGFGLTCFPKDLNALIRVAENMEVDPKVMKAVWEKNLEVRPERDWEQMKGRAVL